MKTPNTKTPKPGGGAAFPTLPPQAPEGGMADGYPYPEHGMSLRDYFAGQAMLGMVSWNGTRVAAETAATSYRMADAMLAERVRT